MGAVHGEGVFAHATTDRTFVYAVAGSLVVHALILLSLPELLKPANKKPVSPLIVARLAPPAMQVPEPVIQPVPARSTEHKEPHAQPAAPPMKARSIPQPAITPSPEPRPAESQRVPEKSIDGAESTRPVPSTVVVPAPMAPPDIERPPVSPPVSADESDPATLGQYRFAIISAAKRFKRYPRLAIDNNWEGQAEIRMVIRADGSVTSVGIKTRSGYEVLDQQALEMIRKAKLETPIPARLRGRGFTVDVPVVFSLKEE